MDIRAFEVLKNRYRNASLIGFAFGAALGIYLGVVFLMRRYGYEPIYKEINPSIKVVFIFLSLGLLLVIPYILNITKNVTCENKPIYQDDSLWPQKIKELYSRSIIVFGLCEIPALLGFILYLFNGQTADFLLFFVIAVVCYVFYFPRYDQWEYELRKMV